jgi:cell division protein FtsW (lipid II flippase)
MSCMYSCQSIRHIQVDEFAKMLRIFVIATAYVNKQRFNSKWLMLSTHSIFHTDRGTQLALTT